MTPPANAYRGRIWALFAAQMADIGPQRRVLDFGCGDGWFARQMLDAGFTSDLVALDVKRRAHCFVEPKIYDGGSIPFADRSFELSYSVDVVHHCTDPLAALTELARVSARFVLLKDHTASSPLGHLTLAVLDELGNRRFGIPSPHHYQQGDTWHQHLMSLGWQRRQHLHPAKVHTGLLGALTNRLQHVSLYERVD